MKLNDLNKQEVAVKALKENFEVDLNIKGLNKNQTQTMHNKVKGLISEAKASKNWALSDLIRDELKNLNITIQDSKDGSNWTVEN